MIIRELRLIWLSLICLSCSTTAVTYKVSYEPIASPYDRELLIAFQMDSSDLSGVKKKHRQQKAFEQAASKYLFESLLSEFKADTNFSSVRDRAFFGDMADLAVNNDANTLALFADLDITKSDGFVISSEEENRNYSTYYASFTIHLFEGSEKINEINLEDQARVDGDELILAIDVLDKQSYDLSREVTSMLRSLAREYYKRWYPRTEEITDNAYTSGKFKGFETHFNKKDFDKAKALIAPYLESKNPSLRMKASYNMFLICEAMEDFDAAGEWYTKYEASKKQVDAEYD